MSIPIIETCRKRKRRPKIFEFHKFAEPGHPVSFTGPFRDNVRIFLEECAEPEDYYVGGMPIWCTLLVHENKSFVLPLYTIEENVQCSIGPYCDHCRCTGWSKHLLSKRKYHLIIPVDTEWNMRLEDAAFDLHTHLLHGLIHCNGFGHLICINGIEGGSKFICGREIMDLWDRICNILRARKITVKDLSKKRCMDLRLLHGIAYGHSWFGRWGYKFFRGSYGMTQHSYYRAIEIISSLEVDKVVSEFGNEEFSREIKQIISHYRNKSEAQLITLRDLLRFMLTVKSCSLSQNRLAMTITDGPSLMLNSSNRTTLEKHALVRKEQKVIKYRRFSTMVSSLGSRWPVRRLEFAAEVIVEALKEKKAAKFGCGGMTRQDVRDAARMRIGDTGLLDYVLKSMNNVIVGRYIVRRAVNPATRILEYTIHELADGFRTKESEPEVVQERIRGPALVPGIDVYSDVTVLYTNLLLNYPESETVETSVQTVLDSKHFVKDWSFRDDKEQTLIVFYQVKPSLIDLEPTSAKELLPGELVVVPYHVTLLDLKKAIANALRDTYYGMDRFVVTDIENLEEMEDRQMLSGKVESGAQLVVRGSGIDLGSKFRYQGGTENWMERCACGVQDDDGERMVACDLCEIWQHTRCCGIEDSVLPPLFICLSCCDGLATQRTEPLIEFGS
ncbi:PHD finger protein MALE MEIOCYTE DEATH 1 [Carica papaya]|uniref:PHD finger protein MALE MEIOCYTE DEATH 1 n=1 Tax=Carica papaya TaxID=3649 RepID=UPI000B8C7436|nr:PHD finger protein MALE MEIOCYTE DEATH 1 [Carica papaya]